MAEDLRNPKTDLERALSTLYKRQGTIVGMLGFIVEDCEMPNGTKEILRKCIQHIKDIDKEKEARQ